MWPITIKGTTYHSYDEMPPEIKADYDKVMGLTGDKNGNNMPDFMDGEYAQCVQNATKDGFVFQGVTYSSLEEMPENLRVQIRAAFDNLMNFGMPPYPAYNLINKKS